jgi:hypothetical protein
MVVVTGSALVHRRTADRSERRFVGNFKGHREA